MPIMAVSAFNGSPELASLLSLRAAIVFLLKTSRFYSRLVPAIAAEMERERELEIERREQQQKKDFLGRLRRPLTSCDRRLWQIGTDSSRRRRIEGEFPTEPNRPWILRCAAV